MPVMAASLLMRLEKMPRTMMGKKDAVAMLKARATVSMTKLGGLMPKYMPIPMANTAQSRARRSSWVSERLGANCRLTRSWEIAVEMTRMSPAAVESAAASPPAATRAMTQLGSCVISGTARNMISLSKVSSFWAPARYWIVPFPLRSWKVIRPMDSQVLNQEGTFS